MKTRSIPVAPDEIAELTIEATGDNGDGLGKIGGYVVFVPGALRGERVRVRITAAGGKHGRAELLHVLTPAPERTAPRCPHFGSCGGCQLQHMAYPPQLEMKRGWVAKALRHALHREIEVAPVLAPPDPWGQRSKVVLHVERRPSGYRAGLYGQRSRTLVPLDQCPAADQPAFRLARKVVETCERLRVPAYDVRHGDGSLRGVLVRATSKGELGVVLISATEFLQNERTVVDAIAQLGAATVWINHLPAARARSGDLPTRADAFEPMHLLGPSTRCVHGDDRLVEELHGVRYLVSAATFFQTSRFGAEQLVRTVDEMAGPLTGQTVVDAYCGGGLFSLALARRAAVVVGVEDDEQAVADAERAAGLNGFRNARFLAGAAQRVLRTLAQEHPALVVLDPPRAGCHVGVLDAVAHDLQPPRVLYVACDTQALARDAATLEQLEYALAGVQPIDMFPWTHHVETVARFERNPQLRTGRKRFSRAAAERLLEKAKGQGSSAASRDGGDRAVGPAVAPVPDRDDAP